MRNRLQLLVVPLLLMAQVAHTVPVAAADSTPVQTPVETPNQDIKLTLNSPTPVVLADNQPNFTADVVVPLRATQAAEAAAAQAAAANAAAAKKRKLVAVTTAVVTGPVTDDVWYHLRVCESGNNYARNSGNGYYGAYQYNLGTWSNFDGYSRPDLAPASVQDAKAQETQAARGWNPWPTCARKLGLL